jgi:glycosyltransferase involved in cell wall biosynthesis
MLIEFQNTTYKPDYGGIVNYIEQLALVYQREHKVRIVASHTNPYINYYEENILVSKHQRKSLNIFQKTKSVSYRLIEIEEHIKKLYSEEKPDIVFSRHPYYAYVTKKLFPDIKLIYIQATALPLFTTKAVNKERNIIKRLMMYKYIKSIKRVEEGAMKSADVITVLSKSKKEEIKSYYSFKGDIKVISAGVDTNYFYPVNSDSRDQIRDRYNIPRDSMVFLYVGRLSKEKNVLDILRVFQKIDRFKKYLIIVGDGPQESFLREEAKRLGLEDFILFTGFLSNPLVYYQLSDVFVLLSKYEGFGQVFLEAMACGLPVIAYTQSPPDIIVASDEIIEDKITGYLVENNLEKLVKLFESIKWSDLKIMSNECRNLCESNYSWEMVSNKLLEEIPQY